MHARLGHIGGWAGVFIERFMPARVSKQPAWQHGVCVRVCVGVASMPMSWQLAMVPLSVLVFSSACGWLLIWACVWQCRGNVMGVFCVCIEHAFAMFTPYVGHVLAVFRACFGNVLAMFRACVEHVLGYFGNI